MKILLVLVASVFCTVEFALAQKKIDPEKSEFDELKQLIKDSVTNWEYNSIESVNKTKYRMGDLVPCSEDQAEFMLKISAVREDKCYYIRKQAFCKLREGSAIPNKMKGYRPEHLVCALTPNGSVSGRFHYTEFGPGKVTASINWTVTTSKNESLKFAGTISANVNQSGFVNCGNDQQISWSFLPTSDLADHLYVSDPAAIETTLWYSVVVDFLALKIKKSKYDELDALTKTNEKLAKLLKRFENGSECIALAAFLNQRYPKKKFNPVDGKFSTVYPNRIPVSLNNNGIKTFINVSPETFGKLCYSYWSRELSVGEFAERKPPG